MIIEVLAPVASTALRRILGELSEVPFAASPVAPPEPLR
jgi:hypothetical protein